MHPRECPEFEYTGHESITTLRQSANSLLRDLRTGMLLVKAFITDTRPSHRALFSSLTPPSCWYYAGNYRGSDFKCLREYAVQVQGDPRVGARPAHVSGAMSQLRVRINNACGALDAYFANPSLPDHAKVLAVVAVACEVFDVFLAIHPYANGNGHIARLIVWALLGRHGYWPHGFTIEPRPPDPPYTQLLVEHRNGNKGPLQNWVLQHIVRPIAV